MSQRFSIPFGVFSSLVGAFLMPTLWGAMRPYRDLIHQVRDTEQQFVALRQERDRFLIELAERRQRERAEYLKKREERH